MEKEQIEEKLKNGWIRVNVMFEVVGNPKEHIENSLKSYLTSVSAEQNVEVLESYTEPAEELEGGVFSTFAEVDMIVKGLEKLTWLCYNYTPASIEIIEPSDYALHASDIQNWVNDVLAKLHEVGLMTKNISSQKKLLVNNMNRLIKNFMVTCLDLGINTPKDMEEKIGIPYDQLKPFFEALIKEGKIEVDKDEYKKTQKKK